MESKSSRCKVCVTGGAGYIGSALVHSLLQNGYTVHATLRNLGDESKVGLLKSLPYAEERLHLFKADIYKPEEFEEAIQGCIFVFHVATPLQHTPGYKYNSASEATTDGVKKIADACIRSGTVKKLIYTGSVVAALTLKDDGTGYKIAMNESCWTPLHIDVLYANDYLKDYTYGKTKSEQEVLKIRDDTTNELEVVTLSCGLVGGECRLPHPPPSVLMFTSQILNNETLYKMLRYLEELLGKIPVVHIEDVCRAHIFCAEMPSVKGRYLCASSFLSSAEFAKYCLDTDSQYRHYNDEKFEDFKREIKWGSKKLEDKGFAYKYTTKMIFDDSLESAKRSNHV